MNKIMKTLSLMFAVGAMLFSSGLHHENAKVAKAATTTATALFGTSNNKIGSALFDFVDSQNNNWNVKTEGTSSFTPSGSYSQIGSSSKPASSIVFTHSVTNDLEISSFSLKVGGFNNTAGAIKINAGSKEIASGSLSGTSDVTVSSSETASVSTGESVTINITSISKGVKIYNFSWSYSASSASMTDEEKIQAVEDAITAIGTVEYSDACKAKIDDARSEYDALDDSLKASVTNYNTLVEAETTYENLKNAALEQIDKDAAQAVVDLINSLPSADSITDYSSNNNYVAAKEAYDSLTDTQKGYVGSEYVTKLNAVGEKLQEYKPKIGSAIFPFNSSSSITSNSLQTGEIVDGIKMTIEQSYYRKNQEPLRFYADGIITISINDSSIKEIASINIEKSDTYTLDSLTYDPSYSSISADKSNTYYAAGTKEIKITNSGAQTRISSITINYYLADSTENVRVSSITLDPSTLSFTIGGTAIINAVVSPVTADDKTITWSSLDSSIASVDDLGKVTANSAGTTTIKATANDGSGIVGTASVTVVEPLENRYYATIIKDMESIKTGDKIAIAASNGNYAMGEANSKNNWSSTAIQSNNTNESFSFVSDVEIITVGVGNKSGTYSLKTDEGYLYAAASGNNYLRAESELSDNSSWTIEIDESGIATLKAQGNNTTNWLRFNSKNRIFSCYTSTQTDICLYKVVSDYDLLVKDVLATNPCKKDLAVANELQERYECLSVEDKVKFDTSLCEDNSTTLIDRLDYIVSVANDITTTNDSNLFNNINIEDRTSIILIVGLLGLTAIVGYYLINKKKYNIQ